MNSNKIVAEKPQIAKRKKQEKDVSREKNESIEQKLIKEEQSIVINEEPAQQPKPPKDHLPGVIGRAINHIRPQIEEEEKDLNSNTKSLGSSYLDSGRVVNDKPMEPIVIKPRGLRPFDPLPIKKEETKRPQESEQQPVDEVLLNPNQLNQENDYP